jgi:hypothetical protein
MNTGGGAGHEHISGGEGSPLSTWPGADKDIPPIFIGNIQYQHISVTGLGNLPSHGPTLLPLSAQRLNEPNANDRKRDSLINRKFFNI